MLAKIKMKYCTLHFDEVLETPECPLYSTVNFEYSGKSDPLAIAFFYAMDKRIRDKAIEVFKPLFNVKDIHREIYLEDVWLMIQGYTHENKHHIVKLIGIIREAEQEFDNMLILKQE